MLSALLVTYVWPPTGGAGVGRVLKLAKYLPSHGVTPAVLTVANPSVPLRDDSLQKDIPLGIDVIRARTFEPGYAAKQAAWQTQSAGAPRRSLVKRAIGRAAALGKQALAPDPQILWQPAAQAALVARLGSAKRDDVVFITAPPFSTFLSAPIVRAMRRSALVLDYRDEWITYRTQYEMMSRLGAVLGGPMEHAVLRCAHMITTATDSFRENLLAHFPFLDPDRVVTIENGFDPDDFPATLPEPPTDRFTLTYAGTVFNLTSPRGLLGAIKKLHARAPALAKKLHVKFIGRIVDTELDAFEGMDALGVERVGYIDKDKVMPALAASHMVLCALDDVPGVERVFPAKIFELLHLDRPCLTLAPAGELRTLVERCQLGPVIAPRDEAAIADALEKALRAFEAGTFPRKAGAIGTDRYDRRVQAGQFADVFRDAVALAGT
ncbi:MAG: glycosyltransferase [Deltaproteobacteria bacterium]|nr:glycosyltransferase [Deltaproteobacteria bacterium]